MRDSSTARFNASLKSVIRGLPKDGQAEDDIGEAQDDHFGNATGNVAAQAGSLANGSLDANRP